MAIEKYSVVDGFRRRLASLVDHHWKARAQFAVHADLSPQAVSNYINGQREPGAWELLKLSRALSVSMEFLLTGKDTVNASEQLPDANEIRRDERLRLANRLKKIVAELEG
jgi:transcriptional regulator with XRE-family HTH domain